LTLTGFPVAAACFCFFFAAISDLLVSLLGLSCKQDPTRLPSCSASRSVKHERVHGPAAAALG
jgi:hypothetical protein